MLAGVARRIETEITGDASRFTQAAEDAAASSEDLRATWEKLQDSNSELSRSIDNLAEKVDELDGVSEAADAFGNMERVLNGVTDQLGVLEEQFGISLGPMQEWASAGAQVAGGMEGIIAGGAELAGQVQRIAPALAPTIAATWAHVTALGAQAVAMIAANWPILAIIAGVALLAAGIILLVQHWDTITEKVPFLGAAVEGVVSVVTGAWPQVTAAFQSVIDFIANNWQIGVALIALPFAPLVLLATDAFGIRSALVDGIKKVLDGVQAVWAGITGVITDPWGAIVELSHGAFGLVDALIGAFGDMLIAIGEKELELIAWAAELPGKILAALGDLGMVLWNAGGALVDGLFDGIRNNFWAGIGAIKDMVDPRNWDFPGLSPFVPAMRHAGEIGGESFGEGIYEGLTVAAYYAEKAARGMADAVLGVWEDGNWQGRDRSHEENAFLDSLLPPWMITGTTGPAGGFADGRVTSTDPTDPNSPTKDGYRTSYIGGGQTAGLAQMPEVGDTFNGMVWTGSYWSQGGAGYIPTDYTGYTGGAAIPVIQTVVMLDGQVLATAVNDENKRAY